MPWSRRVRLSRRATTILVVAFVSVTAAGCVACYRMAERAFLDSTLPKVTHGRGRTAELEDELRGHDLALPAEAEEVTYTLTSSWDLNTVGIRFVLPAAEIDAFVQSLNVYDQPAPGLDPWELSFPGFPDTYGWDWPPPGEFVGLDVRNPRQGEISYQLAIVGPNAPRPVVYLAGAR
jgi:hypothetical protein